MKLLKLFIDKAILAWVLALTILLLGFYCYQKLPMRAYPKLPSWQISVVTTFYGASPEVMQNSVTKTIEQSLTGLDGLDYISSDNIQGTSQVKLTFKIGTNVHDELAEVSARVQSTLSQLPEGINKPQVSVISPNEGPTGVDIWYALHSDKMSTEEISDYAANVLIPKLSSLPNVYNVVVFGSSTSQMSILLNPNKMASYGIDAKDVLTAIKSNNVYSQAGKIIGPHFQSNVDLASNLKTPEQFDQLIIKENESNIIRLKDIGTAQIKHFDPETMAKFGNDRMIAIGVVPTDTANAIQISKEVRQAMSEAKPHFPVGLDSDVLLDQSEFSKEAVHEVKMTIIESVICVFIVIFIFLGSLRSLCVPIVTIPLSLLGGCIIMLALGYSLNSLTLLAWVLSIGLVVDDAIVVIENIHRHLEEDMPILQATWLGLKEITPAVISMTLVVAIVFLPIGFVSGYVGALFKQFAFSMTIIVIISGILALFLSPIMCAKLLKKQKEGELSTKIDRVMVNLRNKYKCVLKEVIKFRYFSIVLIIIGILFGVYLTSQIPSQLAPEENEGIIVSVFQGQFGASVADTFKRITPAAIQFGKQKEIKHFGMFAGIDPNNPDIKQGNKGISFMITKPHQKGFLSEDQLLQKVNGIVHSLPGLGGMAVKLPTLPAAPPFTLSVVLKTDHSNLELNSAMTKLLGYITKNNPRFVMMIPSLFIKQPKVDVSINYLKAQQMGVNVEDINNTLFLMMGKPQVNYFNYDGFYYPVVPQAIPQFRDNVEQIKYYHVKNNKGKMIPLSAFVTLTKTVGPTILSDMNQQNDAQIDIILAPGYTVGDAINYLQNVVNTQLPNYIKLDYVDITRQYMQSKSMLAEAFIIAMIVIYFLLAIMFDSFIDPLIIMIGVIPLCVCFAIYTMYITDCTFNIYTKIGLIMLVGLIVKHGIMIVNFANVKRKESGCSAIDAVLEGSAIRLRPILMTTFAMIFGALPLIVSTGAGVEARHQIGWTIIGGMSFGTLLSLFVVPCLYIIFKSFTKDPVKANKSK